MCEFLLRESGILQGTLPLSYAYANLSTKEMSTEEIDAPCICYNVGGSMLTRAKKHVLAAFQAKQEASAQL